MPSELLAHGELHADGPGELRVPGGRPHRVWGHPAALLHVDRRRVFDLIEESEPYTLHRQRDVSELELRHVVRGGVRLDYNVGQGRLLSLW